MKRIMTKFRFQLYSDIHLEMCKVTPKPKPLAPYLFLAGDIGINGRVMTSFFDHCSKYWQQVYYVLGNHEFYHDSKTMESLYVEYEILFKSRYTNVHLLHNTHMDIDDKLCVYGSPMWTYPGFPIKNHAKFYLNDYHRIRYFDENTKAVVPITPTYIEQYSKQQYKDLTEFLHQTDKKTIVMTHFPPTQKGTSNPKYVNQEPFLRNYFAWPDLVDAVDTKNVVAWLSGHTHHSYDYVNENGVRLISNQVGYRMEAGKTGLDVDGVFEIDV